MTKQDFVDFVSSPKAQVAERAFLSASGWGGLHLMQWLGINPVQTGSLTEVIVQLTPAAAGLAWGLYNMIETKIVARAGAILADRKAGAVVIAPTAPAALVDMSHDATVPGVVPKTS